MRTIAFTLFLVSLPAAPAALGQDAASTNSSSVKIAFENEQIRVLHARYAPHEKIALHSHPARVVVCVTDMHVLTTLPNGQTQELRCKSGDSRWSEDRKSTRLNSSHMSISYADFCLKIKKMIK